jgi:WD40 repeat protein
MGGFGVSEKNVSTRVFLFSNIGSRWLALALVTLIFILCCSLHAKADTKPMELKIPEKFTVLEEILKKRPALVGLILGSESINDNEKQYWFDILPRMTEEQIARLIAILETERRQLEELNVKYQKEIRVLNDKHFKDARLNPRLPTLRIEASGHLSAINALDVSADAAFALTVGRDKTARVWKLPDGNLHQTMRLPIADGHEGKLRAAALHPSEPLAVVGGYTKLGGNAGSHAAYVFHRDNGHLLGRLSGDCETEVRYLKFVNMGKHLLLVCGYELSAWSTSDWKKISNFAGKVEQVQPISSVLGEILVVTDEKVARIRLDSGTFRELLKVPRANFPSGDFNWTVSPDGRRFLWAEADQTKVWLGDVATLRVLEEAFKVDAPGVRGQPAISWRTDGQVILGYSHPTSGAIPLLVARLAGKTTLVANLREPPALNGVVALADGSTLLATAEGVLAKVSAHSAQFRVVSHRVTTYQDSEGSRESVLRASADGRRFEFGFDYHRRDPHVFDLVKRSLLPVADPTLSFPIWPDRPGLPFQLKGWRDWQKPYLMKNRKWEPLGSFESMSTAIAPDHKSFVVGTAHSLRKFDSNGSQSWFQESDATVLQTLVTGNGRLVLSVDGRGVIEWHNYETGQHLLSFFVHRDGKRWVLWTPSGYFDASLDGENLIGWHVNRGADQAADFYPATQFREKYFRPDVINLVLLTLDEEQAVKQANLAAGRQETTVSIDKILPPMIEVASAPEQFSDSLVNIKVRVRTPPDAPSMRKRILVNGEIMSTAKAPTRLFADGTEELILALPPKDSEVLIFADNQHGTSQPAKLRLKWVGEKKVYLAGEQGARKNQKPQLWVLAVGVSNYKDPAVPRLNFAHLDARAFADVLQSQNGKAYSSVQTRVLTETQATQSAVLSGLEWLKTNVAPGDVGIVFLSGHGFTMADDRRYFYGGYDVDLKRLTQTGVPYKAIQDAMVEFNLRGGGTRAVFFIDTCHAGDASGAQVIGNVRASNGEAMAIELSRQENQVLVFASSKGDQVSFEDPKLGHGVFTKALIEGLGDEWLADAHKIGQVTYKSLDTWISLRVPRLSQQRQTPRLMAPPGGVDDFTLATQ